MFGRSPGKGELEKLERHPLMSPKEREKTSERRVWLSLRRNDLGKKNFFIYAYLETGIDFATA